MSLNVSNLTDYKNENTELLGMLIESAQTLNLITIMPGYKGTVKLNLLESEVFLQDGNGCTRSVSGTTTFIQEEVVVDKIKYEENLCPSDLIPKYTQRFLKSGSNQSEFETGLPEMIAQDKIKIIGKDLDKMIWQGDKVSGSGNLSIMDGAEIFLESSTNKSTYVDISGSTTPDNVISKVNTMYASFDPAIRDKEDLVIFVPVADYDTYTSALQTNLNPITPADQEMWGKFAVKVPYKNCTVIATAGLIGTDFWYGTFASNMVYVTDIEDENDNMVGIYNPYEGGRYELTCKFKGGVGFNYPQFVSQNNPNITNL